MKSLHELSNELNVPESTLRLYRDEFDELIPTVGEGRRRKYRDAGVAALEKIIMAKRAGQPSGEIRDFLAQEQKAAPKARRRNTDERLDEIAALLSAQAGEIALLRVELGTLRADIRQLMEQIRREREKSVTLAEALQTPTAS